MTKLNILLAMFFSLAFVVCCLARGNFLVFLMSPQELPSPTLTVSTIPLLLY